MSSNSNFARGIIFRMKFWPTYQQIRNIPRWANRSPIQAIAPEDYDEATDRKKPASREITEEYVQENLLSKTKINWKQPKDDAKSKSLHYAIKPSVKPLVLKKSNVPKRKPVDMLDTTIDGDGNFIYTKMDDNDVRISNIMVEVKSKKEKLKKDLMLLEGKRLIKEALEANCKLEYLLFSRLNDVEYLRNSFPHSGTKLYKMPYRDMQMWSDLTTNPGIMGIFKIPNTETYEPPNPLPITVICDNMREPSNLGAILRTSSCVGCKEFLLTKGCTSLWDTKVLRAACGGHFKLRMRTKLNWEEISSELSSSASVFIADNSTVISSSDSNDDKLKELIGSVPLLPYYGVNFFELNDIVIVIGGETEGISEECYQFAAERKGVRLNVPLNNDMDSLNSNTALAVIAFEIKRQLLNFKN